MARWKNSPDSLDKCTRCNVRLQFLYVTRDGVEYVDAERCPKCGYQHRFEGE